MQTSKTSIGWLIATGATALVIVAAALPPVLDDPASGLLHHAFSSICHQLPERSIHVDGRAVALCHRCTGMLLGLWAGLFSAIGLRPIGSAGRSALEDVRSSRQGLWLVVFLVPTAIDWALGAGGVWANTPISRMLTGAVFGAAAGLILAANLLAPRPRPDLVPTHAV
ncbi:DUF2085 domain-containing protein [Rubrivirga sp.]|uniref:DUF2085 domain-containing protein n=1 Tax=Rubrivirga sp. TaxID=1885344 RepID=UPI003C783FC2